MSARTAGAVVAAVMFVPAAATAQPDTITITTTTTVTRVPDATISDAPPGETSPNATITQTAEPSGRQPRTWRATVAGGLAGNDEAMTLLDARVGVAISRHLRLAAGVTAGSELDHLSRVDHHVHAETASLQYFPRRGPGSRSAPASARRGWTTA